MERPKIWIHLNGRKVVKDHKVDASIFGKLLIQIQKQINIIAEAQYGRRLKSKFRLFLSEIQNGSVNAALEFVGGTLPEFQDRIAKTHHEVYDAIHKEDEKTLDEIIRESLKDPLYGYKLLTSIEDVIPTSDDYTFGVGKDSPESVIKLKPRQKEFVQKMKLKYLQEATIEVIGIITDLHGKDPRYFMIDTTSGERIKVYITPNLEPQVKEYYKAVPVKVRGLLEKTSRRREIKELVALIPQKEIPLQQIGKFKLKQPVPIEFSYDMEDNLWILRNEQLALEGYGKTYKEAIKDLEDSLEGLILGFLAFKDTELAESARKIKDKLYEYLDIEKFSHQYKPIITKTLPIKEG